MMIEQHTGGKVEWQPKNADSAAQALANVDGTGVATAAEAKDRAPVDVGDDFETAERVRKEYRRLTARELRAALDDGEVTTGGSDAEPVTVTVVDGNGNTVAKDFTAIVETDGAANSVSITDGTGTLDVTTSKDAGSSVTVQAVELENVDEVEPSRKWNIDVVA